MKIFRKLAIIVTALWLLSQHGAAVQEALQTVERPCRQILTKGITITIDRIEPKRCGRYHYIGRGATFRVATDTLPQSWPSIWKAALGNLANVPRQDETAMQQDNL